VACNPGFADCDGACLNLDNDLSNCGKCGKTCPTVANGAPVCSKLNGTGSCDANCNTNYTKCAGACVDTQSDSQHCGSCAKVCSTGQVCRTGQCTSDCGSKTQCGTSCVNLSSDTSNCGKCGTTCTAPSNAMPVCNGTCSFQCNLPTIRCGMTCVDSTKDLKNCGACGKVCPSVTDGVPTCSGSGCGVLCNAGRSLCKGACVDITRDTQNCGGCGIKCQSGRFCFSGKCF